jgi:hypothetical protein
MNTLRINLQGFIRRCLERDVSSRITVPEMLEDSWQGGAP